MKCPKGFKIYHHRDDVINHFLKCHRVQVKIKQIDERLWQCNYCAKVYAHKKSLVSHVKTKHDINLNILSLFLFFHKHIIS